MILMSFVLSTELKRSQELESRRLHKERRLTENLPLWERNVLSLPAREWRPAARKDPRLRELWFEGVPTQLRGRVWVGCIGNTLALNKGRSLLLLFLRF